MVTVLCGQLTLANACTNSSGPMYDNRSSSTWVNCCARTVAEGHSSVTSTCEKKKQNDKIDKIIKKRKKKKKILFYFLENLEKGNVNVGYFWKYFRSILLSIQCSFNFVFVTLAE